MVEAAERDGLLTPESVLVESSSGNLGVALSMLAASKGYRFLCVTDSRCNLATRLRMEALGSQVHIITEPDAQSGFLGARLSYLRALCASDDRYVWLDQYTNPGNGEAHHRAPAPAIARLPQRHRDPVTGGLDQRLLPGPVGEEVAGAGDVPGLGLGEHQRRELAHGVVRDLLHVDAHRAGIAHRDGHGRAGVRDGDVQAGPGEVWPAVVPAAART
jgi:hypothetical protein